MEIRRLNGVRALAVLIVFVSHFSDKTHWLDGLLGGSSGQYGVMLFFILSGFLMAYLYLPKAFTKTSFQRYARARFARVVPLYILIVLASYLLSVYGQGGLYEINSRGELLSHLLLLKGQSVLWSVPPEIHFYALFCLLWFFAAKHREYLLFVMAAVMLALFFSNFPKWHGTAAGLDYNLFYSLRSLPFFFAGVLLGLAFHSYQFPRELQSHWYVLALLLIPFMFSEITPIEGPSKYRMWLSFEVLFVMTFTFFAVVFTVPKGNWLLENPIADFYGKISYSFYLLHMPVVISVNQWQLATWLKLALAIVASTALAYLSFRYFEKPMAKLIRGQYAKQGRGE